MLTATNDLVVAGCAAVASLSAGGILSGAGYWAVGGLFGTLMVFAAPGPAAPAGARGRHVCRAPLQRPGRHRRVAAYSSRDVARRGASRHPRRPRRARSARVARGGRRGPAAAPARRRSRARLLRGTWPGAPSPARRAARRAPAAGPARRPGRPPCAGRAACRCCGIRARMASSVARRRTMRPRRARGRPPAPLARGRASRFARSWRARSRCARDRVRRARRAGARGSTRPGCPCSG